MVRQAAFAFELPDDLAAREPPERRGLARDGVRLLAVDRAAGSVRHGRFHDLPAFLQPGDCLVLNASRTLPACLPARLDGVPAEVRLARRIAPDLWSALLLDGLENPLAGAWKGRLDFGPASLGPSSFGPSAPAVAARIEGADPANPRLRLIRFDQRGQELMEALSRLGQPVRYWYAGRPWDLDWYQTVFAREPGSMEMPSAGRAFTWELLLNLRKHGVRTAFVVLHAGLSSYMDREFDATHPVSEEPYRIGAEAAAAVNASKAAGGRIVAVGTTVVRALESAADPSGRIPAGEARTALRITAAHSLKVVDGLLTGFHEPEASHLDLLSAFLPPDRLGRVYAEALREKYLWHEFGDLNLIL